ncbi:MAG: ABC transporter substrate-binding protein [Chloroflexaceae bacterium]|nr:ABC transporter substrate-binding protein [Chloroflexaceae bacterium]
MMTTRTATPTDRDLARFDHLNLAGLSLIEIAHLLRQHGAAHLSQIERIELAERLTRRRFIIGAGALGLGALVGCGPQEQAAVPTATVAATRQITDPTGRSVDVPTAPQRVIVLDPGEIIFHLVELGLVPIGATTDITTVGGNFPALLGNVGTQITPVGDSLAPNLELVAAQKPDLIFYNKDFSDPGLDKLSALAPTVQFTAASLGKDPAAYTRFVADATNRQTQGDEVIQRWEAKLNEVAAKVNVTEKTCVIVLLYAFEPSFNLYGPEYITGYLAERLGWKIVPTDVDGQPLKDFSPTLSLEQLPTVMNADTVLFLRFADGTALGDKQSGPIVKDITSSPIWQSIPAVREGRVIELDAMMARGGYGYVGLNTTLDTIAQALR